MPRQCAHWLAMTYRRQKGVCVCKDVARNAMLKEEARQRLQGGVGAMECKRRRRFCVCKGALLGECTDGWEFAPVVRPWSANTQQVFACHCEERSDVAIRIPAGQPNQFGCCSGKSVDSCVFA